MIKKIKFALLLGDKPCRSLEDVRENFNAEDIIKNFDDGILLNWLKTYNLNELYNKALSIDKNSENKLYDLLDLFFEDEGKKEELKNKYKEEKEKLIQEEEARKKEERRLKRLENKRLKEEEERRIQEGEARKKDEKIRSKKLYNEFIEAVKSNNYKFINDFIIKDIDTLKNNIYLSKKVKIYSENTYSKYSFITHKQCLILYLDSEASIMTSDSLKIYSLNGKFLILNCFYYKSDNENSKVVYVELN